MCHTALTVHHHLLSHFSISKSQQLHLPTLLSPENLCFQPFLCPPPSQATATDLTSGQIFAQNSEELRKEQIHQRVSSHYIR